MTFDGQPILSWTINFSTIKDRVLLKINTMIIIAGNIPLEKLLTFSPLLLWTLLSLKLLAHRVYGDPYHMGEGWLYSSYSLI